ncbi:hypothetical protein [Treponema sp.]|uniref:TPM domain-containing protein n=1 Tax=Treponema sp. TaxID=166 RepID=UPI00298D957D|nr:hypothetical protein [Treponema sp.]MCR5614511.1 hypothetical protein [Treponema sp.]
MKRNIIVVLFIVSFLFLGCTEKKIILEDSNSLLSVEDTFVIESLKTVNYYFCVVVSDDFTSQDDYATMSNYYCEKNNIKRSNMIFYYIGMKNHVISIQVTNFVEKMIMQYELDNAVELMSENFKNDDFGIGITESIKYLDGINRYWNHILRG